MPNTLSKPADPFADPILSALHTTHSHLARRHGLALKYSADVAPFAALEENSRSALHDLLSLLEPGETIWVFNDIPPNPVSSEQPSLVHDTTLPCLQMIFPADHPIPEEPDDSTILSLNCDHAQDMVTLTDIAYPGFFRARTCMMGNYYGIRSTDGTLVALGGERQRMTASDGTLWIELSAVCTHPAHRGYGYASLLVHRLLRDHRRLGATSCLHVVSSNQGAIDLYHRLGFQTLREVNVHRLTRAG